MALGRTRGIVLLMADQLTPFALPFYGHPLVHAPALSRLASEGMVFDAAYCNSPICAPSRYSMLSGRLPHAIGAYDNASEFPAEIPTMAHYLRAAGLRTVLAGKMHFVGPDQLHGYERRLTTDIYPADFLWVPDWSKGPSYRPTGVGMGHVVDAGPCVRNMQIDYDEEVAHAAVQEIYDLARGRCGSVLPYGVVHASASAVRRGARRLGSLRRRDDRRPGGAGDPVRIARHAQPLASRGARPGPAHRDARPRPAGAPRVLRDGDLRRPQDRRGPRRAGPLRAGARHRSWSSARTTARCWASGACGTSRRSSNRRSACRSSCARRALRPDGVTNPARWSTCCRRSSTSRRVAVARGADRADRRAQPAAGARRRGAGPARDVLVGVRVRRRDGPFADAAQRRPEVRVHPRPRADAVRPGGGSARD